MAHVNVPLGHKLIKATFYDMRSNLVLCEDFFAVPVPEADYFRLYHTEMMMGDLKVIFDPK